MSRIIVPGQTLELVYPAHNHFDVPLEFVERKLLVATVTDRSIKPISAKYIIKYPLVRRSKIQIQAHDLDTGAFRAFWIGAEHTGELSEYRLGLVDPAKPGELIDWVDRIYGPTLHEQHRMRKVAMRWLRRLRDAEEFRLKLAAYPGFW